MTASNDDFVKRAEYDRLVSLQEVMYGRLLATIASIISLRDEGTGGHCERVAHNATALAQELAHRLEQGKIGGETDAEWNAIDLNYNTVYWAGILHDLGKVAISEDILNKPGSLTPVEWEVMKQHADIGADCITGIAPEFDAISQGVRYHHEKWDGSGYPEGLSGEEIPIAARCVAISDVFEAMSTKRSYHKALPEKEALGHILMLAGSHLWREGVGVFVDLWEERQIYSSRNRFIPIMSAGPRFG